MASLIRDYEAILIAQPELGEELLSKLQSQLKEIVTRHGGSVIDVVLLGKKKLSYKIGKYTEGIYLQVRFQIPPAEITSLQKAATLMDSIVRWMVVQESSSSSDIKPATEKNEHAPEVRHPVSEEI